MVFWRRYKEKTIADSDLSDDLPNKPDLKGRDFFFAIIWMFLKAPILILMAAPRGYSSPKEKQKSQLQLVEVAIYIVLGTFILCIGYWVLDQGPLSIIEYVLFSLMAHFSHLGTLIAQRIKHVIDAIFSNNPTLTWSKKQKEYKEKVNH
jgi:tryptophan-rich sensory protein